MKKIKDVKKIQKILKKHSYAIYVENDVDVDGLSGLTFFPIIGLAAIPIAGGMYLRHSYSKLLGKTYYKNKIEEYRKEVEKTKEIHKDCKCVYYGYRGPITGNPQITFFLRFVIDKVYKI